MSRIPPALAYLVIYNPTLQPNPEDLTEDRDEDDVTEQAHVLFYTARERAVSRDRILRQVGLAKALANFAEMFTSQPGFDNVHAQKSRLVMISPEPNFWIHACVNLAKTPKVTTKNSAASSGDQPEEFDYHSNSLNDEVLRTQLLQAYQSFRLQHGGFGQIMQTDNVRLLERRLESFFTPWAWQWDVGATPEFGNYLGHSIHPLKKQFTNPIAEYAQHVPGTPTLVLVPPHIVTGSGLSPIYPVAPLVRLLEPLVPPQVPSPQPSPAVAVPVATSAPMHMLATGGNVVTKYITKPAAQVVDPRNWSWPALPFGKGSVRGKGKERSKISTNITVETNPESKGPSGEESVTSGPNPSTHLGPPTDEALSKASRSVSPSTIDHESLLDAQLDMITNNNPSTPMDPTSVPLPSDSDSDLAAPVDTGVGDPSEDTRSTDQDAAPQILVEPSLPTDSDCASNRANGNKTEGEVTSTNRSQEVEEEQEHKLSESTSESLQTTPLAIARVVLPAEDPAPAPSTAAPTTVQVESSTHMGVETTSGSVSVWLDSPSERIEFGTAQKQRVTWLAIPGLLIASVISEEVNEVWRGAAQRLLLSVHETIQKRRLTAAETTLRALNTTKVVAHYPAAQLSGSSSLPQFTSESPQLFSSARALQFSTSPAIREIVTQTRWGTWCAARQSTIHTRVYMEVDRKDANLVEVDHELGSACRRWDESDT